MYAGRFNLNLCALYIPATKTCATNKIGAEVTLPGQQLLNAQMKLYVWLAPLKEECARDWENYIFSQSLFSILVSLFGEMLCKSFAVPLTDYVCSPTFYACGTFCLSLFSLGNPTRKPSVCCSTWSRKYIYSFLSLQFKSSIVIFGIGEALCFFYKSLASYTRT